MWQARRMMLGLAVLIGVLTVTTAWAWGGTKLTVCLAAGLWLIEPTLMAHAPLMKNDVALGGAVLVAVWGLGRWWRKASAGNMALVGVAAALLATTKFSGLIFIAGMVAVLSASLLIQRRWCKPLVALVCVLLMSWLGVWAVYAFRFTPAVNGAGFNMQGLVEFAADRELRRVYYPAVPPAEAFRDWQPGWVVRGILFAHSHRLLPEAYLAGLMYTEASVQLRPTYFLGARSDVGWLAYFPVAWLVKSPLGLIGLTLLTATLLAVGWKRVSSPMRIAVAFVAGYVLLAMVQRFNLGLRHLLPIYPAAIVVMAVTIARAIQSTADLTQRKLRRNAIVFAVGMAGLEVGQSPGIASFNVFGRLIGPERLLSDSNLDWGQDLPALVDWQHRHPDVSLGLGYFGAADPRALGLRYTSLPGDWSPAVTATTRPAVLAVSLTHLQGTYLPDAVRARYDKLFAKPPMEKLGSGKTIWLYKTEDFEWSSDGR